MENYMNSCSNNYLGNLHLAPNLVATIRALGEFKGKQELLIQRAPQILQTLKDAAVIQSTESSNRIEGVTAPHQRIQDLVEKKTTPANRSEQEIAGYRDVLDTIHTNFEGIDFTPGVVLQLHRDLYRYLPHGGGRWKSTNNDITETRNDGSVHIRFQPVAAHMTPLAMEKLHEDFNVIWERGEVDKLLIIPSYILDFLCIHPFHDGNGRMSRLLTLLLMYKAGYVVGRYISLEMLIENQRQGYYDALQKASQGWHEGTQDLTAWLEYFLGVMIFQAYKEFETRTVLVGTGRGAKTEMIKQAVQSLPSRFKLSELHQTCPSISEPMLKVVLKQLIIEGRVRLTGKGRASVYEKIKSTSI
jgi:Fic family protein